MKKFICVLLLVVMLGAMLTGCYTCDLCGESKLFGKNTEKVYGEEFVYCDDCKEELEKFANELDSWY